MLLLATRNDNSKHDSLEPALAKKRFSIMPDTLVNSVHISQSKLATKIAKTIATSSGGLWDVLPPPQIVEMHNLDIGQVDNFLSDKGFGFMDTADGRLFFHASGFRVPRMVPGRIAQTGLPCLEIQLAQVRPKEKPASPDSPPIKSCHIPIPVINSKMGLMFIAGVRNGRRQALAWCLQDMYEALKSELTARYTEQYESWRKLGRYKLELCERRVTLVGPATVATSQSDTVVRIDRTQLFEGTNIDYLVSWFRGCREAYSRDRLADRWIELHFQVFDDETQTYGHWQVCDPATMHDFLGK